MSEQGPTDAPSPDDRLYQIPRMQPYDVEPEPQPEEPKVTYLREVMLGIRVLRLELREVFKANKRRRE